MAGPRRRHITPSKGWTSTFHEFRTRHGAAPKGGDRTGRLVDRFHIHLDLLANIQYRSPAESPYNDPKIHDMTVRYRDLSYRIFVRSDDYHGQSLDLLFDCLSDIEVDHRTLGNDLATFCVDDCHVTHLKRVNRRGGPSCKAPGTIHERLDSYKAKR